MRKALDTHTKTSRPSVETIVERIGPLRNKTASAGGEQAGRREHRRARA
jgi:5-methyltetrahydrofolate--homocysteine methyltransferase